MADYVVAVEGISDGNIADRLLGNLTDARRTRVASRAINKTARDARSESQRKILAQVAFPRSYLNPSTGRLAVSRFASPDDLQANIRGRFAPTSLARFSVGSAKRGAGVTVQVKPGMATFMRRAFLIRLPQGKSLTETKFNLGLAVRLRKGETLKNKRLARKMSSGLYLLYGPSVDQVFRDVSEQVAPGAADKLEAEFLRLLEVF